jgi:hypothetical protein
MHEIHITALGAKVQHAAAAIFKMQALMARNQIGITRRAQHIITDPDLKQIAQDENGICRTAL